jgi:predicted transcriptional regulator YheO
MERQLKYLRALAKSHLLIVVFFENTETQSLIESEANSTEEIYVQTIAEKFAYEKRQIVQELKKYGIFSILTAPQDLTVNTINKYLELKARGLL